MKVPSRVVERSIFGTLLAKTRSSVARHGPPARCSSPADKPPCRAASRRRAASKESCSKSSLWILSTFGSSFISSNQTRPQSSHRSMRRLAATPSTTRIASMSSSRKLNGAAEATKKHDLLGLAGAQHVGDTDSYFAYHRDPFHRGFAQADPNPLRISDRRRDINAPSPDERLDLDKGHAHILHELCSAIHTKQRGPHVGARLGRIYDLYLELPEPRMLYLPSPWRNKLLRAMGLPPKRDMDSMLRYFALLSDVRGAGLTIRTVQWNFAMAFATKFSSWVTPDHTESALQLWKEMEHLAHTRGNEVTFNILFDVASKAGNFELADLIYKEMDARGVVANRYHHVSLMHYFGLKGDSDGMRAAYRDMIEAGELIDTLALNCLIAGFLRCGEEEAALEIYDRMKQPQAGAAMLPEHDYAVDKVIKQVLTMFAKVGKAHPGIKPGLQKTVQLTPRLDTYKILVEHYAVKLGDLPMVAKLLDEMKFLDIPLHATIFLSLLKGFYHHGGFPGTAWTPRRLDSVLSALYEARDQNIKDFQIQSWVVLWALRAVKRCTGDNAEVEKRYEELVERASLAPGRQDFLEEVLISILNDVDLKRDFDSRAGTRKLMRRH